ncbi:MAG TPA: hypothetical protein VMF60_10060, partial [Acidimicrobiales bacterium]|nr:hypothetical protein [Acidimicrobiales bacterium]
KAPEAWRRAHDALVTQVSPYAATDPGEATAEMFKAWWCRSGPLSPVVERFAGLLEEYFPADVAP